MRGGSAAAAAVAEGLATDIATRLAKFPYVRVVAEEVAARSSGVSWIENWPWRTRKRLDWAMRIGSFRCFGWRQSRSGARTGTLDGWNVGNAWSAWKKRW